MPISRVAAAPAADRTAVRRVTPCSTSSSAGGLFGDMLLPSFAWTPAGTTAAPRLGSIASCRSRPRIEEAGPKQAADAELVQRNVADNLDRQPVFARQDRSRQVELGRPREAAPAGADVDAVQPHPRLVVEAAEE